MTFKKLTDLKVGDPIYFTDVNRKGLQESLVKKVGRKYITTTFNTQFDFRGYESNSGYSHKFAYASKEEYEQEVYLRNLKNKVKSFLGSYGFGLDQLTQDQLERIVAIMEENNEST